MLRRKDLLSGFGYYAGVIRQKTKTNHYDYKS